MTIRHWTFDHRHADFERQCGDAPLTICCIAQALKAELVVAALTTAILRFRIYEDRSDDAFDSTPRIFVRAWTRNGGDASIALPIGKSFEPYDIARRLSVALDAWIRKSTCSPP